MVRNRKPFDKAYKHYDRFMYFWKFYKDSELLSFISLNGDEIIADIGGGTGQYSKRLSEKCKEIYIIDESEKMLSLIDEKENIKKICCDALNSGIENNKFDIILLSDVFHHIKNQDELIKELKRLLKPDGILYIYDFNIKYLKTKILKSFETLIFGRMYFRDLDFFIDRLTDNGFEIKDIYNKGYYFFIKGRKTE